MYNSRVDAQNQCPIITKALKQGIAIDFCFPCGKSYCASPDCRWHWASRHAKNLKHLLKKNPMDYYATLKFTNDPRPSHDQFMICWRKLQQGLAYSERRDNKTMEMKLYTDCVKNDVDFNLLIWSSDFKNHNTLKHWLRPIMSKAFKAFSFYLYIRPPGNQFALADYVTGHIKYKDKRCMPPPDWVGKRMILGSRNRSCKQVF